MGCSCSPTGGQGTRLTSDGSWDMLTAGDAVGGGIVLEPFPRQTLVGISGGTYSYPSAIYDSRAWKSIAWWVQGYGSLPGVTGLPLTMYLESSESMNGPWIVLASQAFGVNDIFSGDVSDPASLVRVRIDIIASEVSTVACRLVARIRLPWNCTPPSTRPRIHPRTQ